FLLSPSLLPPRRCSPSLHDALPIFDIAKRFGHDPGLGAMFATPTVEGIAALLDQASGQAPDHGLAPLIRLGTGDPALAPLFTVQDRKSTRLNSSHVSNSYAAFCLT